MIHMLMNNRHTFRAFLATSLMLASASISPLRAQGDIVPLVDAGLKALQADEWEKALQIHTKIVDDFGKNNPLQKYGPQFGTLYYRKGLCELQLKKYADAYKSFEICNKNFPNKPERDGNEFEKRAILRMGDAQVGLEQWTEALANFDKFLNEKDKVKDKYNEGNFHLSVAICHYKLGDLVKGNENLEIAIRNKERFRTPDSGIIAAFQAMVGAAIAKKNESAIIEFIAKNRGDLTMRPYAMQEFSPVFMRLAAEAIAADMNKATIALYQFVPSTDIAVDDLRARLSALGTLRGVKDGLATLIKTDLEADLKRVEDTRRGKLSSEMVKLAAMAYLHEKYGNVRGAFAAYRQLEYYYPNAQKREDNLFNLVRTSAIVSPGPTTQRYGDKFLKAFPSSKYVPDVKRMMLSTLFYDREYALCIEVAEAMRPVPPDTEEHDIWLHVLGGSYFYTGQYDKAQPLLDEHVQKYPKSAFEVSAMYFQAANTSRLQFWGKAGTMLDEFIAKHPDAAKNVFLPFALYDRANCYFAESKYEESMVVLNRIISEFPDSDVIDQTWNLRGNVELSLKNREESEKSHLKALEIAERRKNVGVAAESLFSLVALLGDKSKNKDRLKDAVPYADRYWKEYASTSPYNARMAVAQVAALADVGRDEEALERLHKVIVELAKNPEARGLEELINSYTETYLIKHTPEQLKEHYYNFEGISAKDRAARALLRVAVIGVFEGIAKNSDDVDRKQKAEAMIKVLFRELKTDFKVEDLTNYILVRVGDFLRTATSTPRESLPYYDEVLRRPDQSYRFNALQGRADVYGMSTNAADIDRGIEDFTRIYADSTEKPQREFALYRMTELYMLKKDYTKVAEQARIYLDREKTGFSKFSPQVGLLLAQSFDKRNMPEDAIAMYGKIWAVHQGNIMISAPAITRWMELLWDRNKPANPDAGIAGDRQTAYEAAYVYIELTTRIKDKFTDEELELWKVVEKLVQTYESSAGIKPVKQIRKEKEKGR